MKFVDSNVFIYYIFESSYTERAKELLTIHVDLASTLGVVDEVLHVIIRRKALENYGIKRLDDLRRHIRVHGLGFVEALLRAFLKLLDDLNIMVLQDIADPWELLETMLNYKLAPRDAIITLTCKHYGIQEIITFDEDFKRVPWLKVIS